MYKISLLACSLVLVLVLGITILPCRPQDYALYDELLKSSTPDRNKTLISCSQQTRTGVCKHIWYQDSTPLYIRIASQESELFFFKHTHQIEVIEELGKVACLMQEELYYVGDQPMQRVRYLEAEKACYNYNSHLFTAEEAQLWKYQLEGHTPPDTIEGLKPLMQAQAKSVEFTLKGEGFDFTAHQMRTLLYSEKL